MVGDARDQRQLGPFEALGAAQALEHLPELLELLPVPGDRLADHRRWVTPGEDFEDAFVAQLRGRDGRVHGPGAKGLAAALGHGVDLAAPAALLLANAEVAAGRQPRGLLVGGRVRNWPEVLDRFLDHLLEVVR